MTTTADLLLDARASLGEGPRWDAERSRLWWVDIDAGLVHETDPATGHDVARQVGQKVGSLAPRAAGGLVLAVASGFATLDVDTGEARPLAPAFSLAEGVVMNDGACDAAGRFWAGSTAEDEREAAGSVYRLDPDGTVTEAVRGVTVSNGIGWSLDGRLMYYVDSAAGGIDVFDYSAGDGAIANRRRLVDIPEADGVPDGIAIDDEDAIWVALWGGFAVRRYRPDGTLDRSIAVPTTHVTACAFGGPGGATLYITSASGYLTERERAEQSHAGALFAADPGVTGQPANRFAG